MEEFKLRLMKKEDIGPMLDLERISFGADDAWGIEELERAIALKNSVCLVLTIPGQSLSGFIWLEFGVDHCRIFNLAVDPVHRRRGIGRRMVESLKKAKQYGVTNQSVIAEVDEENLIAQQFFSACGMKCTHIIEDDGITAYEFQWQFEETTVDAVTTIR